jgi:hypothetical protein
MKFFFMLSSLLAMVTCNAIGQNTNNEPFFTGPISDESVDAFIKSNDQNPSLTEIQISSQGGDIKAALRFAQWIKEKNIDVRVRTICYSACANYIFLAGKNKILSPRSAVVWHGDIDQKDLRELIAKCDSIIKRKSKNFKIDRQDLNFLSENEVSCNYIRAAHEQQEKFYRSVGVEPALGRLGQEPVHYSSDGWTLTIAAMDHFGIKDVAGPDDYAKGNYFTRWPLATMMNGGPLTVFDLDKRGEIYVLDHSQSSEK